MIRERILVYGQPGSGKSYSWLQIAAAYPSKKFYCIDTDEAVERLLATEFPQLQNVLTYPSQDWASCVKALDAIKTKGTSNDWVIVDMSIRFGITRNRFLLRKFLARTSAVTSCRRVKR